MARIRCVISTILKQNIAVLFPFTSALFLTGFGRRRLNSIPRIFLVGQFTGNGGEGCWYKRLELQ
ncbi:MAG: hypothetical protein K0Q73_8223, partial [Paenibacillus sp.]|nr:hypothetical protein [Paenibacillus sp.]